MAKNCDNCIYSGRPSYDYPCDVCVTAYGYAPSKWESAVPAHADMIEVVRCKYCVHYDFGVCLKIYSDGAVSQYAWQARNEDDYCSYGERKDNA